MAPDLIKNEKDFENHLRSCIINPLLKGLTDFYIMNCSLAVDIIICKNGPEPALYFIEVKYNKKTNGRLGFGQVKGSGFQPELLLNKPKYFETNLRWILGNQDEEGYWFLTNEEILKFVNGKSVGMKYNGIKKGIYKKIAPLNQDQLIIELSKWLGIDVTQQNY